MQKPSVIDLFSGVGGLSLGAERSGFQVVGAVELDSRASESHIQNFPSTKHLKEDISKLSGEKLLNNLSLKSVDGIIGGPPCQGFSNIGKGEVDDSRNELFIHFFRIVSEIRPSFFLAENVPGILNSKYNLIRETAFNLVSDYTLLPPIKAVASDFGAPTLRTRYFFVGYRKDRMPDIEVEEFLSQQLREDEKVNVALSFEGLPKKLDNLADSTSKVFINESKYDQYNYYFDRVTSKIPKRLLSDRVLMYKNNRIVSGFNKTQHNPKVKERFDNLTYGEQDRVSKCKRLDPNGFAPTLRAGTGSDKGSFQAVRPIHFDQPRVITPREAARIQGFPDWFQFDKTIWHSFRQIGNSVSPLVAEGMLRVLSQKLTSLK